MYRMCMCVFCVWGGRFRSQWFLAYPSSSLAQQPCLCSLRGTEIECFFGFWQWNMGVFLLLYLACRRFCLTASHCCVFSHWRRLRETEVEFIFAFWEWKMGVFLFLLLYSACRGFCLTASRCCVFSDWRRMKAPAELHPPTRDAFLTSMLSGVAGLVRTLRWRQVWNQKGEVVIVPLYPTRLICFLLFCLYLPPFFRSRMPSRESSVWRTPKRSS